MPKLTLTPHGIKAARAAGCNSSPSKRGKSTGWSPATSRRNRDFLKSIDPLRLDGFSLSLSLTFGRDEPLTPAKLGDVRKKFFDRLNYIGQSRLHWLIEFQRDGTPHFHMIVFFPVHFDVVSTITGIERHWLELTAFTGSSHRSQHIVQVHTLTGWLQYLAKHGARGADHYQRSMPTGWETPGRMWGKSGEWPTSVIEYECGLSVFYKIRRWIRNWRVADARKVLFKARRGQDAKGEHFALRRLVSARRLFRVNANTQAEAKMKSELRGFDEWCAPEMVMAMVRNAQSLHFDYFRSWNERNTAPVGGYAV